LGTERTMSPDIAEEVCLTLDLTQEEAKIDHHQKM
jgi:hypothetical protein